MTLNTDNPEPVWKTLLLPFVMSFLLISIFFFNNTYADALFLSKYPTNWLTYYFFAAPMTTAVLFFGVSPFIANATNKQSFLFILGIQLALFINYKLMATEIYVIPFVFALLLPVFAKLTAVIGWNIIATSFDIRVFKQHIFHFNLLGTIGAIATASVTPIIIHFYQSPGLFYASAIASILTALCILKLKPLPAAPEKKNEQLEISLYKQPFFQYLFLLTILSTVASALAAFAFKIALLGHYSQDNLAVFISVFNGSVSAICLLVQLFVAGRLIIWIGLAAMLLILPVSCVILGSAVAVWSAFIPFLILKAIFSILEINFKTPCMQIIMNPYPSSLRKKVSLYLGGPAAAIAGLVSAVIIMVINNYLNIHFLGISLAALSLYWIYITYKANQGYQETLHSALKENRYNPDLLSMNPESIMFMYTDILAALSSNDINIRRTGLEFFDDKAFVKYLPQDAQLEQAIIKSLADSEKDIRYNAAIALRALNCVTANHALLTQFEHEQEETVGWAILTTLANLNILPAPEQADAYLDSLQPFKIAYALIGLDRATQDLLHAKAQEKMHQLLEGSSSDRLLLAKTMAYLNPSPEHNQVLEGLIRDESTAVSIDAIIALKPDLDSYFIPILIELLDSKQKGYFAESKLAEYKDKIITPLLQVNTSTPRRQRQSMTRLLARLKEHAALAKLLELSKSPSITMRLSIANKVRRASNYDLTQTAINESITDMVLWCAAEIRRVLSLALGDNKELRQEAALQLQINRKVFIIWFSLLTDPWRVTTIAKYIEKPEHYLSADVAKAYEFLDNLSTSHALRQAVETISKTYPQNQSIANQKDINPGLLLLANHPYQYQEGTPMNKMDKTALLRRVKLFEEVPVEVLLVIAEIAKERDMAQGEYIFKDQDEPDRFYCIAYGRVTIQKHAQVLSELNEGDYFGELGLLDSMPRTACAVAATDGTLLYIEKEDFINVLEDLPEMMRAVVGQIIHYLRQNLERERT